MNKKNIIAWCLRLMRMLVAGFMLLSIACALIQPLIDWKWPFAWPVCIQFMPALLAGSAFVLVGIVLVTFVFGRVYCSVVCPLGIIQDIVRGVIRLVLPKKAYAKLHFPAIPNRVLIGIRATSLVLFLGGLLWGSAAWLDPYGLFGRALLLCVQGVGEHWVCTVSLLGLPVFVILVLSLWNARGWCNTVCPVGALLGFIAHFARVRPQIDSSACVGCGQCARACDKGCIVRDEKTAYRVHASRCVMCLKCAGTCKKGALKWL